jgi:hypothetical protein
MEPADPQNESEFPSSKEMEGWLRREIADATKALELRIKDATHLVAAYSRGELSADEAEERSYQYSLRWGDALPGAARSQGLSDEEILKRMDTARIRKNPIDKLLSPDIASGHKKPSR